MRFIKSLILKIKLWYYTLIESWDDEIVVDLSSIPQKIQQRQNSKLYRGVKRINEYLRSLSPEDRTKHENLIGIVPRVKSNSEKLAELRAQEKLLNSPTLKTEDVLVKLVVKKAPIYALVQEVKSVRKAMTACLRASSLNPSDPTHLAEMKELQAKLKLLRDDIQRLKND